MNTILVTGAAGFIGFHLAQHYLRRGTAVIGVDNLYPYYPVALKEARLAQLMKTGGERFRRVDLDVAEAPALRELVAETHPEVVVHLAAQAGVRYSIEHPEPYVRSNLAGFASVLEAVRRAPRIENTSPRLVYASSSSVYGGNAKLPFAEDDRTDTPISLYAATKRANELMAHAYTHLYGMQAIGLRFFTVYGPWGRPDMAYWLFTEKIVAEDPIPVFGHGKLARDFSYIDDIVAGIVAACERQGLPPYALYNLGNHRSEPLPAFIATLEEALGKPAIQEMLPMQPGDVTATHADMDRTVHDLGFRCTTPITEGLPRFVEWYQAHPDLTKTVRDWRTQTNR